MLIDAASPLGRLPAGLERRQTLCLDGVRMSAEIVDVAYSRLLGDLEGLSTPECSDADRHALLIPAIQDAWTTVGASVTRVDATTALRR